MKMYIAGRWIDTEEKSEVLNPFNGEVVDTVPRILGLGLMTGLNGKRILV